MLHDDSGEHAANSWHCAFWKRSGWETVDHNYMLKYIYVVIIDCGWLYGPTGAQNQPSFHFCVWPVVTILWCQSQGLATEDWWKLWQTGENHGKLIRVLHMGPGSPSMVPPNLMLHENWPVFFGHLLRIGWLSIIPYNARFVQQNPDFFNKMWLLFPNKLETPP